VLATIAEHMRGADQIPAIAGAAPDESGKQRESVTVMNEVTKIVRDDVDGFDGFEDQIEGEGHHSRRYRQPTLILGQIEMWIKICWCILHPSDLALDVIKTFEIFVGCNKPSKSQAHFFNVMTCVMMMQWDAHRSELAMSAIGKSMCVHAAASAFASLKYPNLMSKSLEFVTCHESGHSSAENRHVFSTLSSVNCGNMSNPGVHIHHRLPLSIDARWVA